MVPVHKTQLWWTNKAFFDRRKMTFVTLQTIHTSRGMTFVTMSTIRTGGRMTFVTIQTMHNSGRMTFPTMSTRIHFIRVTFFTIRTKNNRVCMACFTMRTVSNQTFPIVYLTTRRTCHHPRLVRVGSMHGNHWFKIPIKNKINYNQLRFDLACCLKTNIPKIM